MYTSYLLSISKLRYILQKKNKKKKKSNAYLKMIINNNNNVRIRRPIIIPRIKSRNYKHSANRTESNPFHFAQ